MTPTTDILTAVKIASAQWKSAFNRGDAKGCAQQYEIDAVMKATPFGIFRGRKEIEGFWAKLIKDGFSDVEYIDPKLTPNADHTSAKLESLWKMNKASGKIFEELWVLHDGEAKLRYDHFEAS